MCDEAWIRSLQVSWTSFGPLLLELVIEQYLLNEVLEGRLDLGPVRENQGTERSRDQVEEEETWCFCFFFWSNPYWSNPDLTHHLPAPSNRCFLVTAGAQKPPVRVSKQPVAGSWYVLVYIIND